MENKAIERIGQYTLQKKDYSHLHTDLQAGLVVTAYAITELNSLMRLFLNAAHPRTGINLIDASSWSQRHLLLRTISSKVFEYREMLASKDSKNSDSSWADEVKIIRKEISETDGMVGFKISKYIRHEAANHYSLDAARKNLKHTSPRADFSLYVHKKHGNSFYPAGEEVMFVARLSRYIEGLKGITFDEVFDDWMKWMREVLIIISNNYYRMIDSHIFKNKPGKFARETTYYVPFSMVQESKKPTAPLFMRDQGPSRFILEPQK